MDSMVAKTPSYQPLYQYNYNVSLVNYGQYIPSNNYVMEKKRYACLPGHGLTLHMIASTAFPSQRRPPC